MLPSASLTETVHPTDNIYDADDVPTGGGVDKIARIFIKRMLPPAAVIEAAFRMCGARQMCHVHNVWYLSVQHLLTIIWLHLVKLTRCCRRSHADFFVMFCANVFIIFFSAATSFLLRVLRICSPIYIRNIIARAIRILNLMIVMESVVSVLARRCVKLDSALHTERKYKKLCNIAASAA